MKTATDVESFLFRMGMPFDVIGPDMWNIRTDHENLIVSISGPLVVFRTKVMEIPNAKREELFGLLLRANTTDLVHGAFGIENGSIVISRALELENLDWNEFSAVVDDFTMAISRLYPKLAQFRTAA